MALFSPADKKGCWLVIIGLLSIAVVGVMMVLAMMLFSLSLPSPPTVLPPPSPVLALPTITSPTPMPGPPLPLQVRFVPVEPIQGFSSCEDVGFRGMVRIDQNQASEGVQLIVWGTDGSLLGLDTTAADGSYELKFAKEPPVGKLWIQLYQDDLPVSMPLSLEFQVDCQQGFQIYQVDWRAVEEQ